MEKTVKFKQKEYIAPLALLGGPVMTGLTGAGLVQGAMASKEAEEQADAQEIRDRKITKALREISATADPGAAEAAKQVMTQRGYTLATKVAGIAKNLGGFGKDMGKYTLQHKRSLGMGVVSGATIGAAGYATDKAIQADQKKTAAKAAEVEQKTYAAISGKSILSGIKKVGSVLNQEKKSLILPAAIGVLPAAGYLTDKKIKADMAKEQAASGQRTYSVPRSRTYSIGSALSGVGKNIAKGFKTFKSHPGQSTLGGLSMALGGGGKKGLANAAKDISAIGEKSGNPITQKFGKFLGENKKTGLAIGATTGIATLGTTWGGGEKIVRKTAKALDKNAYKYQESQNQQIE